MEQLNDASLLQEYAWNQSEDAFSALVSRHIDLVYSAARRLVRTPDAADEETQATFVILARKAPLMKSEVFPVGF